MKYFLDTEFHEYKPTLTNINTIELISIGIVREDGKELYLVSRNFSVISAFDNEWLKENVLRNIFNEFNDDEKRKFNWIQYQEVVSGKGISNSEIKQEIIDFVGDDENPTFYGYYADYDWVVFCWLFGRMIDLPRNFPMYCRDLKQMLDERVSAEHLSELHSHGHSTLSLEKVKSLSNHPKQENEHNALADARWNKKLYEFLFQTWK